MSKSSPIIFLDKNRDVVGVFGAAGGFFIPSCLAMVSGFFGSLKSVITN